MDNGNDIGGNSTATGNIITNAGSSASALSSYVSLTATHYIVFSNHQAGENISYNTIASSLLTSNVTEGGILKNYSNGQPAGTFTTTIANNTVTIKNAPAAGPGGSIAGINSAGITSLQPSVTIDITDNTIQNCDIYGNTATNQAFYAILNSAAPGLLNINRNQVLNNSITATTSKGNTEAITNTGACGTLSISNNIFRGFTNTSEATTLSEGYFIAIFTGGQVVNTININDNQFGDAIGDLFTKTNADFFFADIVEIYGGAPSSTLNVNGNSFKGVNVKRLSSPGTLDGSIGILTSANVKSSVININNNNFGTDAGNYITFNDNNTGEVWGIINQGGSATGSVSINGNNFRRFVHTVPGSSTYTFILNLFGSAQQNINDNQFTNLAINSSGLLNFILNGNVSWPANAVSTVSGNKIVGTFSKAAGNGVRLYYHGGPMATALTENIANNQFVNVTVSGTTFIESIRSQIAGSTRTIANNLISNITAETGDVSGIYLNYGTNAVTANTVANIAGQANINGILLLQDISSSQVNRNNINNLRSSSANLQINGIQVNGITSTHNVYRNKIYNLQNTSSGAGTVNGVLVNSGQDVTISNNLVGSLTAPSANNTSDAVRGINIQSTQANSSVKVYYNTVFLDASSTGADFSTSALYHVASNTATSAALDLRNNILVNTSVPNGATGNASAFRRSGPALENYAATSNNNLFYAGVPGTGRNLLFDGVNSYQTLAALKAAVAPRESNSVSEMPPFLSTNGADIAYLHLNDAQATAAANSATPITGITDDYDGHLRSASTPDMGADESSSIPLPVTLEYFRGKKQNASIVLEWKVNVDEEQTTITLERSAMGSQFVSLSHFTPSVHQSQQPFAFTDAAPVAGPNLYRLKITERNGQFRYSQTLAFDMNRPDEIQLYPNPVVSTTTVKVPSRSAADAIINLSDATGKVLQRKAVKLKTGENAIALDFNGFSTGSYFITVSTSDGRNQTIGVIKK